MLLMQQNHSFCDVLWASKHVAHGYETRFWHSSQGFLGLGAVIAAKNPCWYSFSAFCNHPAARRYVRSTSAASRRESIACQIADHKSIYLHSSIFMLQFMLQIQCMHDSPHPMFLPPGPHIPPDFVRSLLLRLQNAIFLPSKIHCIFGLHF